MRGRTCEPGISRETLNVAGAQGTVGSDGRREAKAVERVNGQARCLRHRLGRDGRLDVADEAGIDTCSWCWWQGGRRRQEGKRLCGGVDAVCCVSKMQRSVTVSRLAHQVQQQQRAIGQSDVAGWAPCGAHWPRLTGCPAAKAGPELLELTNTRQYLECDTGALHRMLLLSVVAGTVTWCIGYLGSNHLTCVSRPSCSSSHLPSSLLCSALLCSHPPTEHTTF